MAVATPCLKFPHSSSTTTTISSIKPTSNDTVLVFRSTFIKTALRIPRTRSLDFHPKKTLHSSPRIRRIRSASFENSYSSPSSSNYDEGENDEEFSKRMEDLAMKFQDREPVQSIEMKANSLDIPLSLRMIKRKKKQFIEVVNGKAYCSVKRAFSSMVFIIREMHSYTLQMREILYYENMQGILERVQREMHASFVWLFQQVFSQTPTLMVYVMILLANFTVYSFSDTAALADVYPPPAAVQEMESSQENNIISKFDSTVMKSFTVTSSGSKTTSVGGGNGGGNNAKIIGSGMDGDGFVNEHVSSIKEDTWRKEKEEEEKVWGEIVNEASRMKSEIRDESIFGDEILQNLVSPVSVEINGGDYEDYFKTELNYQSGLGQEPNNVLLLANYAQFLYLVLHEFDRAEEYFKRAIKVEPKDAEAHNKYANFLWQVRNDLWAAEETFLEAISADPSNSYYAANYAHFLWNTGGEDTCFPLDSPDDETLDA